jgi:hypothetical protein
MEELKQALLNELAHVTEIFFDDLGNWFINKTDKSLNVKTRDEILNEKKRVKKIEEPTAE